MPDSRARLADTLRGLREDHTLDTRAQLARRLRLSNVTIRKAETGAYIPGRAVLAAYARHERFRAWITEDELAHLRSLAIHERNRERNGKAK